MHFNKLPVMSIDEFKNTFKVGDRIVGYSSELHFLITAIGETRFLSRRVDAGSRGVLEEEVVAKIFNKSARWRKLIVSVTPVGETPMAGEVNL